MAAVRNALVDAVGRGSSRSGSRSAAGDAAGRVDRGAFGDAILSGSELLGEGGGEAEEEEGEGGEHG